MGMLKYIKLENYKCFEEASIEITPLTILCGVNSSGKSSIIKSLLMLKQSFENSRSNGEITYIGNYVDNGEYKVLANKKNKSIKISNKFILNYQSKADKAMFRELYRLVFGESIKSNLLNPKLGTFTVSVSMDFSSNIIKNYNIEINYDELNAPINLRIDKIDNKYEVYLSDPNNKVINKSNITIRDCECYFDGVRIIGIYTINPPYDVDISRLFNFIYGVFKVISWQYVNDIVHIAPLRYSPHRYHISEGIYDYVGNSGEHTTQILNKFKDEVYKCILAPENNTIEKKAKSIKLSDGVNQWLNYMDIGNYDISSSENDNVLKLSINGQNISDVGFGVGQILPILTQGLIMKNDQSLLLEQPEIHLHPKAQMKMADFLMSLACNKKNIIVETHSDHIINRITRRVMENPELAELVKIYFVYKDNNGYSLINNEIQIDPYKGLINCPQEFFNQYGDELRLIMAQGFINLKNYQG